MDIQCHFYRIIYMRKLIQYILQRKCFFPPTEYFLSHFIVPFFFNLLSGNTCICVQRQLCHCLHWQEINKYKRQIIKLPYLDMGLKIKERRSRRGNQSCDSFVTHNSTSFSVFFKMAFCKDRNFVVNELHYSQCGNLELTKAYVHVC